MYVTETVDVDVWIDEETIREAVKEYKLNVLDIFELEDIQELKEVTKENIIESIKNQEFTQDELKEILQEVQYWMR